LVCDRIEELADARDASPCPRQISIEIISDGDDAVEDEGDRIIDRRGLPQQEDEQRDRQDPRKRQQVRQRQHCPYIARYRVWRHRQSWLCLPPSMRPGAVRL